MLRKKEYFGVFVCEVLLLSVYRICLYSPGAIDSTVWD